MRTITRTEFKRFLAYALFTFSGIGAYLAMLDSPQLERLHVALIVFQMIGFSVFWYWLIYELTNVVKVFREYEG
jgi:uncharacterized membrane protein